MKIERISSSSNPKIRIWKECLKSKGIKEHQMCLVSGEKVVHELLSHPNAIAVIDYDEVRLKEFSAAQGFLIPQQEFKELDTLGTHKTLLLIKTPQIPVSSPESEPVGLEIVLPLGDPANLGGVIRSAQAFSVSKIWLTSEAAHPFLPKCLKGSSGLALSAPLVFGPELARFSNTSKTVVLDMQGTPLDKFQWPLNVRLIVGEEGLGIPTDFHKSTRVSLPLAAGVESLNAAIAASIAIYSYNSQKTV